MTRGAGAEALRFLFASDSFKGTLGSLDAARLLEAAARSHFPECTCVALPMADGGEGTVEAVVSACGGELRRACVSDPLGRSVEARYGLLPGHRAVIETAAASGLTLLAPEERNPLITSTFGTGQLVRAALDDGAVDITLALGGSATNDGGMGCARALGVRFLDESGTELKGTGADLERVRSIDFSGIDSRVAGTTFHALCDVNNPLMGSDGASDIFAPQKGASPEVVSRLERGMRGYDRVLATSMGRSFDVPGAGAAGGLGAGCLAFLGAKLERGISRVLELVGFKEILATVDLCVTGEGHADEQTSRGKVVSGVAAACEREGVPCVAVVGGMSAGAASMAGLSAMVPTAIDAMSLEETLSRAEELYSLAADRLFSLLATGRDLG